MRIVFWPLRCGYLCPLQYSKLSFAQSVGTQSVKIPKTQTVHLPVPLPLRTEMIDNPSLERYKDPFQKPLVQFRVF